MPFTPKGGFPPIVPNIKKNVASKTLEERGFTVPIVSIGDILQTNRKPSLFSQFNTP